MWYRVDVVLTDVSEEGIASIFRVERKIRKSASEETARTVASRSAFREVVETLEKFQRMMPKWQPHKP
jgi:uncharacterized sporulation protein YeaH/YhbH (DUF444 family)